MSILRVGSVTRPWQINPVFTVQAPSWVSPPSNALAADTNGKGVASSGTTHKGWVDPAFLSADDLLTFESPVRSLNDYMF